MSSNNKHRRSRTEAAASTAPYAINWEHTAPPNIVGLRRHASIYHCDEPLAASSPTFSNPVLDTPATLNAPHIRFALSDTITNAPLTINPGKATPPPPTPPLPRPPRPVRSASIGLERSIRRHAVDCRNTSYIHYLECADLLLDLVFAAIYVVEMQTLYNSMAALSTPPVKVGFEFFLQIGRSPPLWNTLIAASCISVLALAARLILIPRTFGVWNALDLLMDALILGMPVAGGASFARTLYLPYFLRTSSAVSRANRLLIIPYERKMMISPRDLLREKFFSLAATICVTVFISMCCFQSAELLFGSQYVHSVFESLYFTVVTLSTVGYGDISPKTDASRLVVIVTILFAFILLPPLLRSVITTWHDRREFTTHFTSSGTPHVLAIGDFSNVRLVADILHTLLKNEPHGTRKIVFMSYSEISKSVKAVLRIPRFRDRARIIHGSALSKFDLYRASAPSADAIFVFTSDRCAAVATGGTNLIDDERNVLRLWSVLQACNIDSPQKCFISTRAPEFAAFHAPHVTAAVCPMELNLSLLGLACTIRGISTLILNLIAPVSPCPQYDRVWLEQYADGALQELQCLPCSLVFVGRPFQMICFFLYLEFNVLLLGLGIPMDVSSEISGNYRVLLNPSTHVFTGTELLILIMHGIKLRVSLANLTHDDFLQSMQVHLRPFENKQKTTTAEVAPAPVLVPFTGTEQPPKGSVATDMDPKLIASATEHQQDSSQMPVNDLAAILAGQLPAVLSGRALARQLSAAATDVKQWVVDDASRLASHLVVFTSHWDLGRFLGAVRDAHVPDDLLHPVLIVASRLPLRTEFLQISSFAEVYIMLGSARSHEDLQRAEVQRAKRIVILAAPLERSLMSSYSSDGVSGGGSGGATPGSYSAAAGGHSSGTTTHSPLAPAGGAGAYSARGESSIDNSSSLSGERFADLPAIMARHMVHHMLDSYGASNETCFSSDPSGFRYVVANTSGTGRAKRPFTVVSLHEREAAKFLGPTACAGAVGTSRGCGWHGTRRHAFGASQSSVLASTGIWKFFSPLLSMFQARSAKTGLSSSACGGGDGHGGFTASAGRREGGRITDDDLGLYHPLYASGEIFYTSMVDCVLMHEYFKPLTLDVVRQLAGVCASHGHKSNVHPNCHQKRNEQQHQHQGPAPSFLQAIVMPVKFYGCEYRVLFHELCVNRGAIPLGLYRAPNASLGNRRRFVYTNPHPEVILHAEDYVFVLAVDVKTHSVP